VEIAVALSAPRRKVNSVSEAKVTIHATSAVLMVLAIFIGAMAWGILDALRTSIEYQREILAELVYAKIRSGDLLNPVSESSAQQEVKTLRTEVQQQGLQISAPAAKA
jgi:hypothetical protein